MARRRVPLVTRYQCGRITPSFAGISFLNSLPQQETATSDTTPTARKLLGAAVGHARADCNNAFMKLNFAISFVLLVVLVAFVSGTSAIAAQEASAQLVSSSGTAQQSETQQPAETTSNSAENRATVIVVVGAAAVDKYAEPFAAWADRWQAAAAKANAEFVRIDSTNAETATQEVSLPAGAETTHRDLLQQAIVQHASGSTEPLWIVLIGHGTYDGQLAKFNLVGPDVSPGELSTWLNDVSRPLAFINCASASSPFLNELSGDNRVIVTATRSGHELNYARFGDFMSAAITDPAADLDKDDQVSLLEAYLTASKRVEEFYQTESRLATEHALMDDNGDKLGTPAAWFRGVHATRRAEDGAALDGTRAHQLHLVKSERELSLPEEFRAERDEIELAIAALREQKSSMTEMEYYDQLEVLMLKLARLYQTLDAAQ